MLSDSPFWLLYFTVFPLPDFFSLMLWPSPVSSWARKTLGSRKASSCFLALLFQTPVDFLLSLFLEERSLGLTLTSDNISVPYWCWRRHYQAFPSMPFNLFFEALVICSSEFIYVLTSSGVFILHCIQSFTKTKLCPLKLNSPVVVQSFAHGISQLCGMDE